MRLKCDASPLIEALVLLAPDLVLGSAYTKACCRGGHQAPWSWEAGAPKGLSCPLYVILHFAVFLIYGFLLNKGDAVLPRLETSQASIAQGSKRIRRWQSTGRFATVPA
eukprot:1144417-Pelagomonas_calceolata.AAC.1